MKLRNIIKRINKRMTKSKNIKLLSAFTMLDKPNCYKEFFYFTRCLKSLGLEKYAIDLPEDEYYASLYSVDDDMDYSHLRMWIGKEWNEYVTIFYHRGIPWPDEDEIDELERSWGINNMQTGIEKKFKTIDELKVYIHDNYEKYGLYLV